LLKAAFKRLRDRAIIAVLLGCALHRCKAAALTDGRSSGGFTPEARPAARHANTSEQTSPSKREGPKYLRN
jgi:hypothetical protein